MLSSHFKGKITELQVAEAFLKLGYQVSLPLLADARYDLIVDINNKLYKIQVKSSTLSKNKDYFAFSTSSSHTNTKCTINKSYSLHDIDYFATIYNNICYLVPYSECGLRGQRLRLLPPKNNQKAKIMYAIDYTLDKIIQSLNT